MGRKMKGEYFVTDVWCIWWTTSRLSDWFSSPSFFVSELTFPFVDHSQKCDFVSFNVARKFISTWKRSFVFIQIKTITFIDESAKVTTRNTMKRTFYPNLRAAGNMEKEVFLNKAREKLWPLQHVIVSEAALYWCQTIRKHKIN